MILITSSDAGQQRSLPFYLAMEEWLAKSENSQSFLSEEDVDGASTDMLMTWVVGPTVIVGTHQDAAAEVRLDTCRTEGVEVYRRRSGGGAVYADRGNLMVSMITDINQDAPTTFARCCQRLVEALRSMGVSASATGRNDIEVNGRKVSGGAFHLTGKRGVAHFTLLFSADQAAMKRLLTPPAEKLARHAVTSVEARVGSLKPYLPFDSTAQLASELEKRMARSKASLTPQQTAEVVTQAAAYENLATI